MITERAAGAVLGDGAAGLERPRRGLALLQVQEALADEVSPLVQEAMTGLWEHEPPLEVDVGRGRTWLEAK